MTNYIFETFPFTLVLINYTSFRPVNVSGVLNWIKFPNISKSTAYGTIWLNWKTTMHKYWTETSTPTMLSKYTNKNLKLLVITNIHDLYTATPPPLTSLRNIFRIVFFRIFICLHSNTIYVWPVMLLLYFTHFSGVSSTPITLHTVDDNMGILQPLPSSFYNISFQFWPLRFRAWPQCICVSVSVQLSDCC